MVSGLVTTTVFNTKISKVENEILLTGAHLGFLEGRDPKFEMKANL